MAAWSDTTKHLPSSINSGNQYTVDDDVSLQELNNTVENAFYAVRVAENAEAATNNGVSYDAQSPTSGEKYQARSNIGALSSDPNDLSGGEMQSWQTALGISGKADKDAANLGGEDAAEWKTALGINGKANTDASNLSSANVSSWQNTCGFERVDVISTTTIQANGVLNADFSKYKRLRIYWLASYIGGVCELSLIDGQYYVGYANAYTASQQSRYYADGAWYTANLSVQVNTGKTQLTATTIEWAGTTAPSNERRIFRVEGVY